MKKLLASLMILSMLLSAAACSNKQTENGKETDGSDAISSDTQTSGGDSSSEGDTTGEPPAEPDYLQFAVSEGDYGDLFRNEGKWSGERVTADQVMSITGASDTETLVEWVGVAAGISFEYETKIRIDSFGDDAVTVLFETETHEVNLKITSSELVALKDGGEEKIAHETDSDWHIYRFNVTDAECKLWVDGVLLATYKLPEKATEEGRFAFSTAKAAFGVNYVKVKTTVEDWVKPEDRPIPPAEVTEWSFVDEFEGDALDASWIPVNTNDCSYTVANGELTMLNSVKGEFKLDYKNTDKIPSAKHYVMEVKMKTEFVNFNVGTVSLFLFTGSGFRIHSQVLVNTVKVRNTDGGWDAFNIDLSDGEYHTYRYELEIGDDSATYQLYVDGTYIGTGLANTNGNAPYFEIIDNPSSENAEMSVIVDYVKVAVLG